MAGRQVNRIWCWSAIGVMLVGSNGGLSNVSAGVPRERAEVLSQCMVCEYPSPEMPVPGYHHDFIGIINTHFGGEPHYTPIWGQCGLYHSIYFF